MSSEKNCHFLYVLSAFWLWFVLFALAKRNFSYRKIFFLSFFLRSFDGFTYIHICNVSVHFTSQLIYRIVLEFGYKYLQEITLSKPMKWEKKQQRQHMHSDVMYMVHSHSQKQEGCNHMAAKGKFLGRYKLDG